MGPFDFCLFEGDGAAIAAFEARLRSDAPPLARIAAVDAEHLAAIGARDFRIEVSTSNTASSPVPARPAPRSLCRTLNCRAAAQWCG